MTSNADPLDLERWEKLRSLQQVTGRDFLNEVIDLYAKDAPERLRSLREALAEGEAKTAERLAHSLKGSSSNIGAPIVESLAAELEMVLAEVSLEKAGPLVERLATEIDRVCQALQAMRSS